MADVAVVWALFCSFIAKHGSVVWDVLQHVPNFSPNCVVFDEVPIYVYIELWNKDLACPW